MKKGNIIYRLGLLFIFVGIMFPGSAGAVIPAVCGGDAPDLSALEDIYQSDTYSENPSDCFSFTVGNVPGTLTVTLAYTLGVDILLNMNLFDSSETVVANSINSLYFQGAKSIFYPATSGEIYYIQIVGDVDTIGHPYQFKWVDQDNTADPTIIEGSENPTDDGLPFASGVGGQMLRVEVENTVTCHIYYKDEDDVAFTDSGELSVSEDGGVSYCEVTVPYGDNMDNNGVNYWYVQAGTTRYPSTGTLSFTVSTTPGNKPVIAPMLMLLLNKENKEPPSPTLNPVIAPILMLLL